MKRSSDAFVKVVVSLFGKLGNVEMLAIIVVKKICEKMFLLSLSNKFTSKKFFLKKTSILIWSVSLNFLLSLAETNV